MLVGLFFHNQTIDHILSTYGYAAVFAMVAVESLGVPVPGREGQLADRAEREVGDEELDDLEDGQSSGHARRGEHFVSGATR